MITKFFKNVAYFVDCTFAKISAVPRHSNFYLGHIVGVGLPVKNLVDEGVVRVSQGIIIAEKIRLNM